MPWHYEMLATGSASTEEAAAASPTFPEPMGLPEAAGRQADPDELLRMRQANPG